MIAALALATADGDFIDKDWKRYEACVSENALRLEPAGEPAELTVDAALHACKAIRLEAISNYAKWASAKGNMTIVEAGKTYIQIFNDQAEQYRQDALLKVLSARAARTSAAGSSNAPN